MTHPLKKYLEDNEISQGAFGKTIGFDRVTVNRVLNGGGFSVEFVEASVTATQGLVSANDFFQFRRAINMEQT